VSKLISFSIHGRAAGRPETSDGVEAGAEADEEPPMSQLQT
jgi:hypothetical protein